MLKECNRESFWAGTIQASGTQPGRRRTEATVVAVDYDLDLAVLKLSDPVGFEEDPVKFSSELPAIRDKVTVYGYPVGGKDMSATAGIVSRIEYRTIH